MNYTDEDRKDKKYKKGYSKKDFKRDVTDAVKQGQKVEVPIKYIPKKKRKKGGEYSDWNVTSLRKKLNEKKPALLKKSGFPDGKLPRSKDEMISLCKKLKRKRW